MPFYMTQFSYTLEAWQTLAKNPEDRGAVFKALVEKLGGTFHNIYYCFGEYDGLVIYEFPDNTTAGASIITVALAGHLKATKTTALFTMKELMEMMGKAGQIMYPAPKG